MPAHPESTAPGPAHGPGPGPWPPQPPAPYSPRDDAADTGPSSRTTSPATTPRRRPLRQAHRPRRTPRSRITISRRHSRQALGHIRSRRRPNRVMTIGPGPLLKLLHGERHRPLTALPHIPDPAVRRLLTHRLLREIQRSSSLRQRQKAPRQRSNIHVPGHHAHPESGAVPDAGEETAPAPDPHLPQQPVRPEDEGTTAAGASSVGSKAPLPVDDAGAPTSTSSPPTEEESSCKTASWTTLTSRSTESR